MNDRVVAAWAQYTASSEKSDAQADLGAELGPLVEPRLRRWRTLIQSSANPISAAPTRASMIRAPGPGEGHPGHGMGHQVADDHRAHDADAPHGGRARLGDVDLGTVLADLLADVVLDAASG